MHVIPGPGLFHESTPTQFSHVLTSANNIVDIYQMTLRLGVK